LVVNNFLNQHSSAPDSGHKAALTGESQRSRRLRRLERGADFVPHLILGALHRNQVLDRTSHTDQSNWRLLDRRTAPVSTALASCTFLLEIHKNIHYYV
jgi:hypothetical protein